jgi:two-component system, CitB family, sensor kinase
MHLRLQTKLVLLITSLLLIIILFLGVWVEYILASTLKDQIGTRVLNVAETVAEIPEIKAAFLRQDPSKVIQPLVEKIRIQTGAEFITVGNKEGIRYSHPDPERIGKEMEGGDNSLVLQGKSIISEAVGSLGPSLRGKVPIFDQDHQVMGIVSVGFLLHDVNQTISIYRNKIFILAFIALLLGLAGAIGITRSVKKAMLGLEPEEISLLYQEKYAILDSVREGIVAVNAKGIITMINHAALDFLGIGNLPLKDPIHINQIIPHTGLLDVLQTGTTEFDQEFLIKDDVFIVNRLPIFNRHSQVVGAVSSFRSKSEMYKLIDELSETKRYAEALRAQTHEYSNKLYMILGLIQLESYAEAAELISREVNIHQDLLKFIMEEIPDPMIGGLLLGKFNRANELKVDLRIDRESTFSDIPETLDRNFITTILGNLLDNGIEAVLNSNKECKQVHVFLTDIGKDLIMEVEDNGVGIAKEMDFKIFESGFSTKENKGHGYGLALVQHAVKELGGHIHYTSTPGKTTIFTVVLPKGIVEKGREGNES